MATVRKGASFFKKAKDAAIPPNQEEDVKKDVSAKIAPTSSSSNLSEMHSSDSDSKSQSTENVWWSEVTSGWQSVKWNWDTARLTIPLWAVAPIVAFLVFSNGLHGGLVFDDSEVVGRNPDVRGTRDYIDLWWNDYWGNLINEEGVWSCKSYRPVTVTTLRWNFMLHGQETFGYHLVNVLLHSACTLLLYFAGLEVFRGDRGMSVLAALLFATHPIHTDAIDSIVGRAEGLYGLFYLMAFLAYVRCASPRGTSWGWYCGYVVCFILSVLSKEMGLMVLANCWAWDLLYNFDCWSLAVSFLPAKFNVAGVKREGLVATFNRFRPLVWRTLATTVVGVAFMVHRKWWVGSFADLKMQIQHNPIAFAEGQEKWLTIFYLHFQYMWIQLWPAQLSCDYSMACIPMVTSLADPRNLLTILTYVGFVVFLVLALRSQRWHAVLLVSLSWYIVPFIPASQVLFQPGTVIAERVLYIPSIGICLITSWLLFTAWRCGYITKEVFLAVCLIVLLAYSARTLARNPDWNSQLSLFKSASEVCYGSGKAHYNYAAELEMGHLEAEAEKEYLLSAAVSDSYTSARGRLGKIWLKRGNLTKSLEFYANIVNHHPKLYHEFAWHDTAYILWQLGDIDKAITFYHFAMSITPKGDQMEGDAETNLGCLYLSIGNVTQAMPYLEKAAKLKPDDDSVLNNLAVGYYLQKRTDEALALFTKAASRPTVRSLVPTDNVRRMSLAAKDPNYNPVITFSALIRP